MPNTKKIIGRKSLAIVLAFLMLLGAFYVPTVIPPVKAEHPAFTFAAVGNLGITGDGDKNTLLNKLNWDGVTFLLALGDLGYQDDEQLWCNESKGLFNNIIIIAGNHDTGENVGGQIADYVTYCPFPLSGVTVQYDAAISSGYGYEYYFDYPATNPLARFIMITPNVGGTIDYAYTTGSTHYNWVVNSVNDARAKAIPWVAVGMHKQCFTIDGRQSCPESGSGSQQHDGDHGMHDMFNKLVVLKVDLILQAHEHNYQRGVQFALNPTTCTSIPHQGDTGVPDADCIVDNGLDNHYTKDTGTVFAITGAGGRGSEPEDTCASTDVEASYFAKCIGANTPISSFGTLRFKIGQSFGNPYAAAEYVPNQGGWDRDAFVISKNLPLPTTLTLNPTADARIEAASPDTNFGTSTTINVDNSPMKHVMIKWTVTGIGKGIVTNTLVKLTLTTGATAGAPAGGDFKKSATDTWIESGVGGVTWNNAPAQTGNLIASMGAVNKSTAYSVLITPHFLGDGTTSFRISSPNNDGADYRSKEYSTDSERPKLIITYIAESQVLTFSPVADAYTNASAPTVNYGTLTQLQVDSSPHNYHSLLKFTITGIGDRNILTAKLTLRVGTGGNDGSTTGGDFYRIEDNSWAETLVTSSNEPVHYPISFLSLGPVSASTSYTVDLTSMFNRDGTYSIKIISESSDAAIYNSREGAVPPSLQITVSSQPSQIKVFNTIADAYIAQSTPDTNFGSDTSLRLDNSPVEQMLLKFDVTGLTGTFRTAMLRIFQTDSSDKGGDYFNTVSNTWVENTVTWNNAPATSGSALWSLGAVRANRWYTVDITSLVTGNAIYSLRVTTTTTDAAVFSSKEYSPARIAELVITFSGHTVPLASQLDVTHYLADPSTVPQMEPDISINPTDPSNLVYFGQSTGAGDYGIQYSVDSGRIWQNSTTPLPTYQYFDPQIEFDANGNAYSILWFETGGLLWPNYIVKSTDNGRTFTRLTTPVISDTTTFKFSNGTSTTICTSPHFLDYWKLTIDKSSLSPYKNNIYVVLNADLKPVSGQGCSGTYFVSIRSTDSGSTWTDGSILGSFGFLSQGAATAVNGTVFAAHVAGPIFAPVIRIYRSGNGGVTWTFTDTSDGFNEVTIDHISVVASIVNPSKLWLVFEDDPGFTGSTRIWSKESTDNGYTWAGKVRVDDSTGFDAIRASASFSYVDGKEHLAIAWYDTRNGAFDIYYSYLQADGTFLPNIRLTTCACLTEAGNDYVTVVSLINGKDYISYAYDGPDSGTLIEGYVSIVTWSRL